MESRKINNKFLIRLKKGEKIIETLIKFCKENNINSGYLFAIGAISKAELAHYNLNNKEYSSKTFDEQLEVCSLTGNIAFVEEELFLHVHVVLADDKMQTYAGHLKEGVVSATLEVILTPWNERIDRKHSEEIGLNLLEI
ncbi:MAG: DNA-binding protein [Candidatus Woesearchaeota archaeon]|jgi:hypothetical protein|nr:DNA-binding protein [Candidatus Woesearchaeota archaeon]MDP7506535.1 DNA-binding protein [Candidatus Woesearchaeota archaeon]MDP7610156.1 DNA-binding protein [Candidatus Woesearchaeota archaeon]|tara:strand:+ start:464 stop:883 length:420 start_codon:yes stop_codon:yes gene_type:complete